MKKLQLLFSILFLVSFCTNTKASHLMGGNITYQWINGNTYQLTLVLYRDCSGILAPGTVDINYSSTCNPGGLVTLDSVIGNTMDVTPICPNALSYCNGGTNIGFEKYVYSGILTLPATCSDWQFTFES